MDGNTLPLKQQLQNDLLSIQSYHSIILNDFIEQVVAETIAVEIYEEFLFIIKDKEQTYTTKLLKEINILESKYQQVILIVKYFETEAKIKELNPDIELQDSEAVWKALLNIIPCRKGEKLQVIANRAARLLGEIKVKEAELKQVQKVTEGGKADRTYFNKLIVAVSTFHKMQIDRRKILLCEFVEYFLSMREQQEYLEREMKKKK